MNLGTFQVHLSTEALFAEDKLIARAADRGEPVPARTFADNSRPVSGPTDAKSNGSDGPRQYRNYRVMEVCNASGSGENFEKYITGMVSESYSSATPAHRGSRTVSRSCAYSTRYGRPCPNLCCSLFSPSDRRRSGHRQTTQSVRLRRPMLSPDAD